ncbi:MAG: nucleotidyltransferase domain-containing protein [Thermoproteota archaeon]
MNLEVKSRLSRVVERIKSLDEEGKVQFVILFGSSAVGDRSSMSDTDLAIGHEGTEEERFDFRVRVSGELHTDFDIKIFQDLPLYVKKEVLKGKVLYVRDIRQLHEIALETIRDYAFFEPVFLDYIQR